MITAMPPRHCLLFSCLLVPWNHNSSKLATNAPLIPFLRLALPAQGFNDFSPTCHSMHVKRRHTSFKHYNEARSGWN